MHLELRDIHKYFGRVRANNGINLTVEPGRIHGILGENGAGKSTLMKILAGYIQKTRGSILIDNSVIDYNTPDQAARHGIGMLYQDPLDYPVLTVLDNFMLGQMSGVRNKKSAFRERLKTLAETFRFNLHPDTPVAMLTIGERQQLEIMRLLSIGIKVLILDEPTTGISTMQKETLFSSLRKLASEGESVILVSHKLEDVEALCDTVTVLRQGQVTGLMDTPFETTSLLRMMFGTPPEPPGKIGVEPGNIVLSMANVSALGGRTGLSDVSIEVRQGEVVGLAGLEGSGQDVFLRIASGLIKPFRGSFEIQGQVMNHKDYHACSDAGVAFMPASRLEEGLIRGLSITEHFALKQKQQGFLVNWKNAFRKAESRIDTFNVIGRPESTVESLSGGNQQRLLLSFLPQNPALLLLENPTRGLDMESVRWVWDHLHTYCEKKTSIIFSSSELDEIVMVADRVLVFFEGRVVKDVRTDETCTMELGRAIAGRV